MSPDWSEQRERPKKKFVDEYILTGNATEAAKRAGYSTRTAYSQGERLLRNAEVRAAIDKRLAEAASEKTLTQKQLLEFLSAVVRGAVKDETVQNRLIGKGCSIVERVEIRASVRERVRAAELLLKIHGAFNQAEDSGKPDFSQVFTQALEKMWEETQGDRPA